MTNPRRRNSANTREEDESVPDCAWCGAACDQPHPYPNRRGEVFCSPSHRSASNRALARVLDEHGGSSPRRRRNPRDPQTETPAFKEWFRDSKIVDAEGNPLVVYHGGFDVLNSRNGTFRKSKTGALGSGIYFTPNRSIAENYVGYRGGYEAVEGGVLTEVYLSIQNPLVVRTSDDDQGGGMDPAAEALILLGEKPERAYEKTERIRERLGGIGATLPNAARAAGYDGIIRYDSRGGHRHEVYEIVAFEPWQVKSATRNAGTYNRFGSDIRTNPRRNPDRWRRGKCLVFAEALKRVAGRRGTLYDVVEVTPRQTLPHHVALRIGDTYWDSEGPSTEAELLARWAARAPAGVYLPLRLEKHDPKRARDFRYPSMKTCSVDDRAAALLHAERMFAVRTNPATGAFSHNEGEQGTGEEVAGTLDGDPVGSILVFPSASALDRVLSREQYARVRGLPRGKVGWLGGIELPESSRNKGHGAAIVTAMLDEARALGVRSVVLHADSSASQRFWARMGFVVQETRLDDVRRGLWMTPMVKVLSGR